jgi:hypothetical protein
MAQKQMVNISGRPDEVDPRSLTRRSRELLPAPARLSWTLERPLSEGEHPAILVARNHAPTIDLNRFILGHRAGGAPGEPGAAGVDGGH